MVTVKTQWHSMLCLLYVCSVTGTGVRLWDIGQSAFLYKKPALCSVKNLCAHSPPCLHALLVR